MWTPLGYDRSITVRCTLHLYQMNVLKLFLWPSLQSWLDCCTDSLIWNVTLFLNHSTINSFASNNTLLESHKSNLLFYWKFHPTPEECQSPKLKLDIIYINFSVLVSAASPKLCLHTFSHPSAILSHQSNWWMLQNSILDIENVPCYLDARRE